MSDLIKVDFKAGRVLEKINLDEPALPEPGEWKAMKDREFLSYLGNVAYVAEMMANQFGGDWRKLTVVFYDKTVGENGTCLTLWDQDELTQDDVELMLSASLLRLRAPDQEIVVEESRRDDDPA